MLNVQLSDQAQRVINAVPAQERKRLEASIEYLSSDKARMYREYALEDIQENVVKINDHYFFFTTGAADSLVIEDVMQAKNFETFAKRDISDIPSIIFDNKRQVSSGRAAILVALDNNSSLGVRLVTEVKGGILKAMKVKVLKEGTSGETMTSEKAIAAAAKAVALAIGDFNNKRKRRSVSQKHHHTSPKSR